MEPKGKVWLDNGMLVPSLRGLVSSLQLPHAHSVLAMAMDEQDRCFALIRREWSDNDITPYVVYRVDVNDGSCHGGQYVGDYATALKRFVGRLQPLLPAPITGRPTKAQLRHLNLPDDSKPLPARALSSGTTDPDGPLSPRDAQEFSKMTGSRQVAVHEGLEYVYSDGQLVDDESGVAVGTFAAKESVYPAPADPNYDQSGEGAYTAAPHFADAAATETRND